ncbi:hypothetical protein JCM3765_005618 [Sporobolomyces pararoseus]
MEAYLDGIPRSTSSGSLSSAAAPTSNSNSTSTSGNPHSRSASGSSFWLGGISSVWSGLKAAAGVEVKGFLKAVTSAASASGEGAGTVRETANTGDKRNRSTHDSERSREKRRRLEHQKEELLSDQVPPLMPPISPAPRSSRSRHHPASSSASPETTRKRLRPYTDPSYADELMYTTQFVPAHSKKASLSGEKAGGGGLRSLSGKRRLDANGSAATTANDSAMTTAVSSSRDRSLLQQRGGGQHHVKFAFSPPPTTPGLARPKSPTSRLPKQDSEQAGSMLMANVVGQVWKEAKEKEKTVKTQKKIEDLENEVVRLKTELSSKLVPPSLPAPPKSPFKSPRRSVAPPPPPSAPPLPPIGRPASHPLLFTARASLRATPPRPSASSSHKRRSSAIGGVQDMDAFLGELGEKRGKLRKVGLPTKERQSSKKGGEGELTEVLQKAFARKFAKTNGLASPSFDTPIQSSKSTNNLQLPQWSASAPTLSASRSHPTQLSSLSLTSEPIDTLPPQPIFHSSSSSSTLTSTTRLPRTTSLACTETTVFGHAVSIDEPSQSSGSRSRAASHSHELYLAASATTISPSLSTTSLPSVPPEELEARSSLSRSPRRDTLPSVPASSNTTPARKFSEGGEGSEIEGGDPNSSASQRLSAARKRTSLERLPGLDAGTKRPVTPGRSRSKSKRKSSAGSSPLVVVKTEEEDEEAFEVRRGGGERSAQGSPRCRFPDEEDVLHGEGTRSPQPQKPFGKA